MSLEVRPLEVILNIPRTHDGVLVFIVELFVCFLALNVDAVQVHLLGLHG